MTALLNCSCGRIGTHSAVVTVDVAAAAVVAVGAVVAAVAVVAAAVVILVLPPLLALLVLPSPLAIPPFLIVSPPPHRLVSPLSRHIVFPPPPIALVLIVFVVFVVVGGVGAVVPLRWAGTVVIGMPRGIPKPSAGRWGGGPSSWRGSCRSSFPPFPVAVPPCVSVSTASLLSSSSASSSIPSLLLFVPPSLRIALVIFSPLAVVKPVLLSSNRSRCCGTSHHFRERSSHYRRRRFLWWHRAVSGMEREEMEKTNHDGNRGSFSGHTAWASHPMGPPFVLLRPQFLPSNTNKPAHIPLERGGAAVVAPLASEGAGHY